VKKFLTSVYPGGERGLDSHGHEDALEVKINFLSGAMKWNFVAHTPC